VSTAEHVEEQESAHSTQSSTGDDGDPKLSSTHPSCWTTEQYHHLRRTIGCIVMLES